MKLSKLFNCLAPKGSLRGRAFSVWRLEGFIPFLKRGSNLVFRKSQQVVLFRLLYHGKKQKKLPLPDLSPSLNGKADIICFSIIDWDFRFQRPQQLLTQFANDGHRIFYISPKFGGVYYLNLRIRLLSDKIYELILPGDDTLAIYRDALGDPTITFSINALNEFIRQVNINESICMLHHPFWLPLVRLLKEQFGWKIVYDCMDDISEFEVTHSKMIAFEQELVSQSDLVITTSQILIQRIRESNRNCILIPNASDYEHFSDLPAREKSPLTEVLRPVIGYYGAISEWFDVQSVHYAALQHPEWSFVLIGYTWGGDVKKLGKLANVHFLGEKTYAELPGYLAGFDVCTIPFIRNKLTDATNPIKFFEYLSAGKPIVATSLPELQPYQDVAFLYSTSDEFVAQLEYALKTDTQERIKERRAVARENTWNKRYKLLKPYMERLYSNVE